MSYDFELAAVIADRNAGLPSWTFADDGVEILTDPVTMVRRVVAFDANYTVNVSPMFRLAFGGLDSHGVHHLHGMSGAEAVPVLKRAVAYFEENRESLEDLNPSNGWGSRQGAKELLENMLGASELAPEAIWSVQC